MDILPTKRRTLDPGPAYPKRPFKLRKISDQRKLSENSDTSQSMDFGQDSDSLDVMPSLGNTLSSSGTSGYTIFKFAELVDAKTNLLIYGRDYTIPVHDFPLCRKSISLARLIRQPGNELKQTFRFADKVSASVAVEFLGLCYDLRSNWSNINTPYDFMQLYFLVDMHFSQADKTEFLQDLSEHIVMVLHSLRNQQSRAHDEQGCNLFFLSYELKLQLPNCTWMYCITHFRNAKMRHKLRIEHINFLEKHRRPQDYRINGRFFKFLVNLCIYENFKWEDFQYYSWIQPSLRNLSSLAKWVQRQSTNNKSMLIELFDHIVANLTHN